MSWWTAARVEELTSLVRQGIPYKTIGARMGTSKNAALSKAYGLGLNHPNSPPKKAPAASIFPPAGHCLWAHGHVGDPAFRFCGEPAAHAGEAWCAEHRARVYAKHTTQEESTPCP